MKIFETEEKRVVANSGSLYMPLSKRNAGFLKVDDGDNISITCFEEKGIEKLVITKGVQDVSESTKTKKN